MQPTPSWEETLATHCPINIKANCYKTFVRSILEYTSSVWSLHLQTDISKLKTFNVVLHAMYWMTTHGTVV